MREPQRREPGFARRTHLCDHLRDAFGEVEALRELRVNEQTDFHDGLFLRMPRAAYSRSTKPTQAEHHRCADVDNIAITCYYAIRIPRYTGEGLSASSAGLTNWIARSGVHDCRLLAPDGLDHVADRQITLGWSHSCIPPVLSRGVYGPLAYRAK